MGFKLTKRIIREFRPQFATKNGPKRDPVLESVLVHIADRTKQSASAEESPTREGGCTLSRAGLADQSGMARNTVKGKIDTLIAMGVLVEDYRDDRGVSRFSIDITALDSINNTVWECQEVTPQGSPDGGSPSDHQWSPSDQDGGSPSDHKETPVVDPVEEGVGVISRDSSYGGDGVTSFTEAQSTQEIDDDDEEIDQGREGEGDSTSITDPDDFSQSEEAPPITANSAPLSGHDVSPEQAREPSSETQSSQVEESPTGDPQGSQNGSQPLQNPDPKAQAFGWQPSEKARSHARAICPDVNLDIIITEYWLWCHDKKINPTASHWMKWVTRAQRNFEDAQAEKRREEAMKSREEKPWYERDLRF